MKQVRGKYRRNQVNHNHDQMAEITCFGAIVFLTFALKLESPKSQKYAHEVILQSVTSKILCWKKYTYVQKTSLNHSTVTAFSQLGLKNHK